MRTTKYFLTNRVKYRSLHWGLFLLRSSCILVLHLYRFLNCRNILKEYCPQYSSNRWHAVVCKCRKPYRMSYAYMNTPVSQHVNMAIIPHSYYSIHFLAYCHAPQNAWRDFIFKNRQVFKVLLRACLRLKCYTRSNNKIYTPTTYVHLNMRMM